MQSNQSTTSLNATEFHQDFEAQVDSNMNPIASSSSQDQKLPITSPDLATTADGELNEKMAMKDQDQHDLPPRFSTIFDTKLPTKLPTTPTRAFESYPQQPTRKSSGVYIAKPLFWALFAIFMLESATLFAYTVIGLVNNMQSQLIHTNGAGAVVAGCDCNSQPINISPNFYMAQGPQASVVETVTSSTSSTLSSTSSTPTSSSSTSIDVSRLAELMKSVGMKTSTSSTHTPSTEIVVVTPPGPTISSTTILTVDPSGSTIAPESPVTSTKLVDPDGAEATLNTRDEPTSIVSTSISGPGITITPVVVTPASDGSLVSVLIDQVTTSTTVLANKSTQDSKLESSSPSTVSTTTSNTGSPTALPVMVPFTTKEGVGILVSVSMSSIRSSTPAVLPSILLSLKSHHQLADKPTQAFASGPSSTATVSTTTTSSISTSSVASTSASLSSTLTTKPTSSPTSTSTKDSSSLPSSSSSTSESTTQSESVSPTPTPAPTEPTTTLTSTLTAPTPILSAENAKASCDSRKILGFTAVGCELPADSLDKPAEAIGDVLGGIF